MPRIKVDKNDKYPRPYWPQELKEEGFVGDLTLINDAMTATIIHPKASLEQVRESLKLVLRDIELRIQREKTQGDESQEPK